MHSCVYVLIGPDTHTDIRTLVAQAMAPFDENRTVPLYKLRLPESGVRAIAEHFKLPATDLDAIAFKLPQWMGYCGGVDEFGLYMAVNRNPDAKWDWYEIGGRWDGYLTVSTHWRGLAVSGLRRTDERARILVEEAGDHLEGDLQRLEGRQAVDLAGWVVDGMPLDAHAGHELIGARSRGGLVHDDPVVPSVARIGRAITFVPRGRHEDRAFDEHRGCGLLPQEQ